MIAISGYTLLICLVLASDNGVRTFLSQWILEAPHYCDLGAELVDERTFRGMFMCESPSELLDGKLDFNQDRIRALTSIGSIRV